MVSVFILCFPTPHHCSDMYSLPIQRFPYGLLNLSCSLLQGNNEKLCKDSNSLWFLQDSSAAKQCLSSLLARRLRCVLSALLCMGGGRWREGGTTCPFQTSQGLTLSSLFPCLIQGAVVHTMWQQSKNIVKILNKRKKCEYWKKSTSFSS